MINLFSATLSTEHAVWSLHGVTQEEILSWSIIRRAQYVEHCEKYFRLANAGWAKPLSSDGESLDMGKFTIQIVLSSYRPEETLDEFVAAYKPIGSKSNEGDIGIGIAEGDEDMVYYGVETYGADLELVRQYAVSGCVATVIDNDRGGHSLIGGMHYVNRVYYLITELPVPECISIDLDSYYENPLKDDAHNRSCEYAINQVFTQCDLPWDDLMQALEEVKESGQGGGFAYIEDIDDLEDVHIWEKYEDEPAGAIQSLLEDFRESSYKLMMDFAVSRGITHQQ